MFHAKIKNTFFCWQTRASKKWEMKPKTYLSNFFSFFCRTHRGEAALTRPVLTRQMLPAQYRVHINTQTISFNCMWHAISRLCCNMAVECVCVSLFVLVARLPESVSAPAVKTKTMMHDNLQVQSSSTGEISLTICLHCLSRQFDPGKCWTGGFWPGSRRQESFLCLFLFWSIQVILRVFDTIFCVT